MVPVARACAAAAHEVVFAAGAPVVGEAEADGFRAFRAGLGDDSRERFLRRFPDIAALPPVQIRTFFFTELFVRIELEPRAVDLLRILERWTPQLIVHEVAEFAAPLVATRTGIPYADHSYGPAVQNDVIRAAGQAAAPYWRAHRLSTPALAGLYRHLYLDVCPPSLQAEDALTGKVQPVRVVNASHPPTTRLPWLEALSARPIVYVTLGTVYNTNLDVFKTLLSGLAGEALNLVVTVGTRNDPAVLGRQPDNGHVHRYIPQEQLLPHCAAVVTHGGAGSTLGALAFGLPLLIVPQGADQFYNAERATAVGAALRLMPHDLTPQAARGAIRKLLGEQSFRLAAQRVSSEIEAMPDPQQAVGALEQLAAS
jgi:UDP:flavonoid glycosyltransferase YjiC (YdhE family)